ncbi:MAG: CaiB/BaiF CoA-transferase family protein [Pseudomonadota bacterium]
MDLDLDVRSGPLTDVRVVEFGGMGPGPFAAMMLGDAGADVVRLERPGGFSAVDAKDATLRSRRIVEIDLKSPDGVEAASELIAQADILIEGYRPGVIERLGFAPEVCLATNPKLVFARITGWGQSGPLSTRAGHDINYIALAGVLHPIGYADAPPPPPLNMIGDYGGGGMLLAFGALAALTEARRTGKGQVVDAAMCDGASLMATLIHGWLQHGDWSARRETNILDGAAPFYRCYACADGGFVAVGAIEAKFYAELLDGLGLADDRLFAAQHDVALWPAQRAALAEIFATQPRPHWEHLFAQTDACVTPVLALDEAAAHPASVARNAFVEIDEAPAPAPAPRFGETPASAYEPRFCDVELVRRSWSRPPE